jgi:SAM-dependent MidA family methyltransferase
MPRGNNTPRLMQRELMPEQAAAEHGALTRAHLIEQIAAAGGWLGFERFMDLALYAPGLGYYSVGTQKLGSGGDFTTAPELSGLFGSCVALQCAEILAVLSAGSILELGAGSGRLAADVLARLDSLGQLPQRYFILEISADLRERQRHTIGQRLPHLLERVRWLDRPPEESFEGVILANEVLDALPVARFCWHANRVDELGVVMGVAGFEWAARAATQAMTHACRELSQAAGGWDDGYVSEYCPRLVAWTQLVTHSLRRGAALWFDYGLPRRQYYLPERHDGTLICHFQHRAHNNPFLQVGLQDISAWVDFTLLAEASREAGFQLGGFTTQALFLAGTGIDQEMQRIAAADANLFALLANQARQLMLPGEMGERFKAMAWLRGLDSPLAGFALQDLRHTL